MIKYVVLFLIPIAISSSSNDVHWILGYFNELKLFNFLVKFKYDKYKGK